jgi:hypothetical protein
MGAASSSGPLNVQAEPKAHNSRRRPPLFVFGNYVSGCYIRSVEDPARESCLKGSLRMSHNAAAQARWRAKNNAYATIARAHLNVSAPSPAAVGKRQKLETERGKLATAWTRQLVLLADAHVYFSRLKGAPMSEWASQERAAALAAMRRHEIVASALDTLLKGTERALSELDRFEQTMAESRRHLAGHRGRR